MLADEIVDIRVRFQWERLGTAFPKFFGRGNAVPTTFFPDKLKKQRICISKIKVDLKNCKLELEIVHRNFLTKTEQLIKQIYFQ